MNKFFDYLKFSSREVLKLIYKIESEDKIRIFGEEFIENNGNKGFIIYKDKIIPLQVYFLCKDIYKDDKVTKKFEILLLELEDISNKSCMFNNCNSLIELDFFEENKNELRVEKFEEEKYSDSYETNNNNLYLDYNNEVTKKEISINIFKKTLIYFANEFNKIDKTKINSMICLKNMNGMFAGCSSLISIPDISKWNTNDVKEMNSVFSRCSSLISIPDISKWNTNNVKEMDSIK